MKLLKHIFSVEPCHEAQFSALFCFVFSQQRHWVYVFVHVYFAFVKSCFSFVWIVISADMLNYTFHKSLKSHCEGLIIMPRQRQAANQHRHNQLCCNHLSSSQRSNDYQSWALTCRPEHNHKPLEQSLVVRWLMYYSPSISLHNYTSNTFISITAGSRGITRVRITGISQGLLRVSPTRAAR